MSACIQNHYKGIFLRNLQKRVLVIKSSDWAVVTLRSFYIMEYIIEDDTVMATWHGCTFCDVKFTNKGKQNKYFY